MSMVPQNEQSMEIRSQTGLPSFMSSSSPFDPSSYYNSSLDPSQAAKQMAALTAASQARMANSRPTPLLNPSSGTNSAPFLGGTNPPSFQSSTFDFSSSSSPQHGTFQTPNNLPVPNQSSLLDSMYPQSVPLVNPVLNQRKQVFLNGLAFVMSSFGNPLPPTITGILSPNYDPNTSQWKSIEPSLTELGAIKIVGRDVSLFQLWGSVFQSGGGHAVTANHGWNAILAQLDLPEEVPRPAPDAGSVSVVQMVEQLYMAMLFPFEQWYKSNAQEQQKKALISRQGGPPEGFSHNRLPGGQAQRGPTGQSTIAPNSVMGISSTPINGSSPFPPTSLHTSALQTESLVPSGSSLAASLSSEMGLKGFTSDTNMLDQDIHGIKRKIDYEEREIKRARQRTGSEQPSESSPATPATAAAAAVDRSSPATISGPTPQAQGTMSTPPRPRQQPSRRKIEYIPLAREVESYGGRDIKFLETELGGQRRPIRDINDWGTVDIEALTMSVRSRLAAELSYALTTFTLLSTMRGQTPGSGFPVFQSPDLFDEVLDLLEEQAFGEAEESTHEVPSVLRVASNRELVNLVLESESQLFVVISWQQGRKKATDGPRQRPGNIILTVLNIIRNLSTVQDNLEFMSRHTRLIDLLLRLCTVMYDENDSISPSSTALSLGELVQVRRDVLYTLVNIAGNINLSTPLPHVTSRLAIRSFQLVSSYLIDPIEAIPPLACVQLAGTPLSGTLKPPALADAALDIFSRLSQADSNRRTFSKFIPEASLIRLFEALVHRLPVVDADFQLVGREVWLSYLEKTVIILYSLAFLSPPHVKQKLKSNRSLGFKTVMLRMMQKFLVTRESRVWFGVCTRRVVETMKVLDDAEDCFDTSKSTAPTMSFGMGFGEAGDNNSEKGTGLLGGYRDLACEMLMLREVQSDEILFSELESLSRVEHLP